MPAGFEAFRLRQKSLERLSMSSAMRIVAGRGERFGGIGRRRAGRHGMRRGPSHGPRLKRSMER